MEIKLINAAYQDRKQMKHAKINLIPSEGGGGGERAKFSLRMVTTFTLMLKLRVEDLSECLPYKASEAFGFIPITFGRLE